MNSSNFDTLMSAVGNCLDTTFGNTGKKYGVALTYSFEGNNSMSVKFMTQFQYTSDPASLTQATKRVKDESLDMINDAMTRVKDFVKTAMPDSRVKFTQESDVDHIEATQMSVFNTKRSGAFFRKITFSVDIS